MTKHIDLSKSIKEQYPKLYKKIPRFVLWILEKIIVQKELNRMINKYIEHDGVAFTHKMIEELNLDLEILGRENLPENRRCFFAANHHFGILDGMLLGNVVGSKYGLFMGIANDAFLSIPQLKSSVTVVNVYGKSAKNQIMELDKLYKSDLPINHFPAGEVARKYQGKVQDKEWQKSFITKAITEKRDIVPILFVGKNSKLFYNVHSIRKFLGLKANIELMLLPSKLVKKRNARIKIVIGKPVLFSTIDSGKSHQVIAEKLRKHLYSLNENPEKEFILDE